MKNICVVLLATIIATVLATCPPQPYDNELLLVLSPETYILQRTQNFYNVLQDYGNQKNDTLAAALQVTLNEWLASNSALCLVEYGVNCGCFNTSAYLLEGFAIERATRCYRNFLLGPVQFNQAPTETFVDYRFTVIEEFLSCNATNIDYTPTVFYTNTRFTMSRPSIFDCWQIGLLFIEIDNPTKPGVICS